MSPTTRATTRLMLASWLAFAQLIVRIYAQNSSVVCGNDFGWMNNTRGQNPCVMASYASAGCFGAWNIPPLPQGQAYVGPKAGESSLCVCNTVTYSLVSACAACQNGQWRDWPLWSLNCTARDLAIATYPLTIPSGTAFPAWAYINPNNNTGQAFDTARAFALDAGNFPDSSGSPSQTAPPPSQSLSTPSGSSTISTTTGAPTVTVAAQSTTDVPSIVGGTVGGVLGLALIGVLIYFIYKHNEAAKRSPSSVYMATRGGVKDVAPSFRSARSPPNGQVSPYKSPPSRTAYSPEVPTSPSPLLIGSNAALPPLVPIRHQRQYESPANSSTQYNPGGHARDLSASTLSTNQHHHAYGGSISVAQQGMQYPSSYAASTHSSQRLEPNRFGSPISRVTGTATPEPYRGRPQI